MAEIETDYFSAWIVRRRQVFFLIIAVFYALAFNGQWRIGRDSAAYRGIARNLATGHGYVFRDKIDQSSPVDKQDIVYPGLPLLLAGIQKALGTDAVQPQLLAMYVIAALTLLVTYRLCRLVLPHWLAVAVVFGMGINEKFLEHANEVLSDLPFQLGLTMALYGFELLRRRCASTPDPRLPTPDSRLFFFPRSGGQRVALLLMAMLALYVAIDPHLLAMGLLLAVLGVWSVFWAHCPADGLVNPPLFGGVADAGVRVGLRRLLYPLAMLGAGLLLAATMRPTFWILLVSLVLACAVGLLRPPRLAPAITILVLAAAALLFVLALDLRHQGVHPLKGGYEDKVMAKLAALPRTLAEADEGLKHKLLQTHVTMLLHGIELLPTPAWAGRLWTLLLLAAAVGLARRNLLWGLLVICSVVTIAIFGSVPRYFLVILPMLLAGYGLLTQQIAVRLSRILPSRWAGYLRTGLMLWGLGLVTLPNCVRCLDLAAEQHGLTRHGLRPFVEAYDSGKWQPIVQISRMIHDNVSPGQRVLGPEATVTAFLSQRQVLSLGMLVSHDWKRHFSRQVLEARLDLVVMPKSVYLVENRDRIMDAVLRWRLLVESDCVADSGPYRLSHFSVRDGRGQHLIPVRHTHRETAAPVSTMTATFPDS